MQRLIEKSGKEMAYVMVNCESGEELKVIDEIGTIDGIKEIRYTFGSYDIVTKIECMSVEELRETISLKIRKIDGVHSTTTLICNTHHPPLLVSLV